VAITGKPAFLSDLNAELEHDLLRAELVSFPLALLVLLWVFRTLVAALLPIVVGGLAVLSGVAAVLALSHGLDMAQYTLNVVSLIGLGVAIDYSLFIVSRFRAELEAGKTTEAALERAVDTAGRAVAFSGLAVAAGLSGLLFYRGSYLAAMGLGGAIVVETIFTLPGIGRMTLDAVLERNYPVVQSTVLVIGALFMLVNLATDILYGIVDPRVRRP